jgi:hypothetical protein
VTLSQQCDQVATKLSVEGDAVMRGDIAGLRSSYVDFIQGARKVLKTFADTCTAR